MRLGIFGGSFDPVHTGHLVAARACLEQAGIDRMILVPAGVSPFKQDRPPTAGRHRAAMLELATAGDPLFEISTIELGRDGPSYTADTLEQLRAAHPGDTLLLVVGPDSLASFPTWRRPDRILKLAELLPVERQGLDDLERLRSATPALEALVGRDRLDRIIASRVRMPPIEVRSTDLRRAVAEGRPLCGLTPPAVEDYIRRHRLYRA